jgi:FAD/FMN-containing dehydrogenase
VSAHDLAEALAEVVGADHVLADADTRIAYERDLTGRFSGEASLVVRPKDLAEVADAVRLCAAHGVPLAVQGGNTGMVGGAVPRHGEVALNLARLVDLDPVDALAAQVECGAGVTLESLQQHARAAGFDFPVDLPSRGTATIGGMVATNAGGHLAARYGMMRAWVAGVEAVLADGTVVSRLAGLVKDNAGYDLTGLLVGSEGTLGIVTRVRLRLTPLLRARAVALLGCPSLEDAQRLLAALREHAPSLQSADYLHENGMALVCEHRGLSRPFATSHDTFVVAECAAGSDPTDELAEAVVAAGDAVRDAAFASDVEGRRALWLYREAHNEAITIRGVPHKLDVSVPLAAVPAFERDVEREVTGRWADAVVYLYGHLGDGNVHVNVLGPDPEDDEVDDLVLRLVARHGGSISAEHGVGVAKTRWLGLTRGEAEIAAMRAIKEALDPLGVLNPGRVLG